MRFLENLDAYLVYGDRMNKLILEAAGKLDDAALDLPFDMGVGTLRKTLLHIHAGEDVWLKRWRGEADTPWPDQSAAVTVGDMAGRFRATCAARDAFLDTLKDDDLSRRVTYRDSKGGLFSATLGEMLIQGAIHSIHHRAQAVNMIRRLGGGGLDMDYMYFVRQEA